MDRPGNARISGPAADGLTYHLEIHDLTEVKRVQENLQETLEEWHSLATNAPDTTLIVDVSGKVTYVDRPLWGYSTKALLGTTLFELIPKSYHLRLRRCLIGTFERGETATLRVKVPNGLQTSWHTLTFGRARATDGRTTTIFVVREITERKQAERMLRGSTEQLRNLAARVEAVREEERARVAREIHDELGQALTVLKLDLAEVQRNVNGSHGSLKPRLQEIIEQVDNTIDRVRTIAAELRPSILDHFGLNAAIEWQASQLSKRTGIQIRVTSGPDETTLPAEVSIAVFRVVQEALTNVLRHANASKVNVKVSEIDCRLRIAIADNGVGLTHERLTDPRCLGILGMRERIERLGGQLRISSSPGKGTRLNMVIPLQD